MAVNTYTLGTQITLTATFTDANGDAADPTAIVIEVKDPGGNVGTYAYGAPGSGVSKVGTGVYRKSVSLDESGDWYGRCEGTGDVEAADEVRWKVRESEFD